MGGAITAAFVSTFPRLVEREVVLVASAGLVEVRRDSVSVSQLCT
jgi:hypothetical protein